MSGGCAGGRGGRGGHTAYVNEVYERDEIARDARMKKGFQRLKAELETVVQRLEALEVANWPRYRLVQPRFPKEKKVSNDVSISKPLVGNHQTRGRTIVNEATIESSFTSNIISDPIVDWSKPPVFDEESVENITKEKNQKILEKKIVTMLEGGEIGWGNQFEDSFWEYTESVVNKNIWIAYLEQVVTNNFAFIFQDSSLQFGFGKINLSYKLDADKVRHIQLYKLEDEFLQDRENDAE